MGALFVLAITASLLLQISSGYFLMMGLIVQGMARGTMMTVAILVLMETPRIPKEHLGLAGVLFFTFAEIGGVMGPISFGVLSDMSGNFVLPLGVLSVLCIILLCLLAQLHRFQKLHHKEPVLPP